MNQSFGRDRRLLNRGEFDQVFQAPDKRSSDRYFTMLGRCRCGQSRLGLAIAKRQIAKAHERNRVKRLARESFRQYPAQIGYDVVLLAKHSAQFADNGTLLKSLRRHLDKVFA